MSEQAQAATGAPQKKDPMILTKSVNQSVNDKGKKRLQLSLSQEETVKLIEALSSNMENARGVKLDIHVTQKVSQAGRPFDSAFFFVKPIQEPQAFQQGGAPAGKSFTAKPAQAFDVKAKIEQLKAGLGKPVA